MARKSFLMFLVIMPLAFLESSSWKVWRGTAISTKAPISAALMPFLAGLRVNLEFSRENFEFKDLGSIFRDPPELRFRIVGFFVSLLLFPACNYLHHSTTRAHYHASVP